MQFRFLLTGAGLLALIYAPVQAQDKPQSYPDHVAKVLDVCPDVKLSGFDFTTKYEGSGRGFQRTYSLEWSNTGKKPVAAFEIRALRFDPFNDALPDFASLIPGHNSGDFTPLAPGERDSDGFGSASDATLFSALIYVSKIRYVDGTVWRASEATIKSESQKAIPSLVRVDFLKALKTASNNAPK